jgi:hypothetical protein
MPEGCVDGLVFFEVLLPLGLSLIGWVCGLVLDGSDEDVFAHFAGHGCTGFCSICPYSF